MYPVISASQWGSPLAPRNALLIHGLVMTSNSWENIAQLLVAEGFFVIAPNLLGHTWRQGSDYRMSSITEDLRPYFAAGTSYDVIVGRSFGGTVALALLPFLPKTKETTIILLDPILEVSNERIAVHKNIFHEVVANPKTAEEHMAEHPTWSRRDCVLMPQGAPMCYEDAIRDVLESNTPWSFSGMFKNIPSNVKITILAADPKLGRIGDVKHIPRNIKNLDVRVLLGVGHTIAFESPNSILDVITSPRAKL